ncbi:hypothetical protein WR25_15585 [Diploscapter pachys]|uniref:MARVEL domain-containing protein n=1 Tax=Diploscapter pachys TaxID=2018661 RepID=A0A2A2LB07_9BILA|nr:hypothetical protein WR25_15585 [Diploscapter pachys]
MADGGVEYLKTPRGIIRCALILIGLTLIIMLSISWSYLWSGWVVYASVVNFFVFVLNCVQLALVLFGLIESIWWEKFVSCVFAVLFSIAWIVMVISGFLWPYYRSGVASAWISAAFLFIMAILYLVDALIVHRSVERYGGGATPQGNISLTSSETENSKRCPT